MAKNWQNFLSSVMFNLLFPLIPLLFEFWQAQKISESSILLVASIYPLSIGITSRNSIVFVLSIFVGVLFAFAFGINAATPLKHSLQIAVMSIIFFLATSCFERYNIHIKENKKFFQFL